MYRPNEVVVKENTEEEKERNVSCEFLAPLILLG
jgi:hypothetical protein